MTKRDIQYLLKKYETKQAGEPNNNKYMQEWRTKQKLRTADTIMQEMRITGTDKEIIYNIIKNVELKELHRNAKCETIITAICFYTKKLRNTSLRVQNYRVCNEHDLTENIYSTIITRLCNYYQQHTFLF